MMPIQSCFIGSLEKMYSPQRHLMVPFLFLSWNIFGTLALYLCLILILQSGDIKTLGPDPALKGNVYYSIPSNYMLIEHNY